jgi:hypothetical protein
VGGAVGGLTGASVGDGVAGAAEVQDGDITGTPVGEFTGLLVGFFVGALVGLATG